MWWGSEGEKTCLGAKTCAASANRHTSQECTVSKLCFTLPFAVSLRLGSNLHSTIARIGLVSDKSALGCHQSPGIQPSHPRLSRKMPAQTHSESQSRLRFPQSVPAKRNIKSTLKSYRLPFLPFTSGRSPTAGVILAPPSTQLFMALISAQLSKEYITSHSMILRGIEDEMKTALNAFVRKIPKQSPVPLE